MPINHPYDPRYNAKIYIPKLTEEQRLARSTPLESLRRPRPTIPAVISVPNAPLPQEVPVTRAEVVSHSLPAPQPADESDYLPTAREVVFAEFPEIFGHTLEPAHTVENENEPCVASAVVGTDTLTYQMAPNSKMGLGLSNVTPFRHTDRADTGPPESLPHRSMLSSRRVRRTRARRFPARPF